MPKKQDDWDKWVSKNPLRVFRTRQELQQNRVASRMKVTPQIVRLWEQGTSQPNDANMVKIAKLTRTDEKKFRISWKRWLSNCPA
jgi:DNA-binding transcriptional regulator YiaG